MFGLAASESLMCALTLIILIVMQNASQIVCNEEAAKIISSLVYTAWQGQQMNGGFTCSVDRTKTPRWIINGNQEDSSVVFEMQRIRVYKDWNSVPNRVISHISIPAIQENSNGVLCKCRAYITGTTYIESGETGFFSIQGRLQMLPNVTTVSYNRSHIIVIWNMPFTLNITEVEPDILEYTVCSVMPIPVNQNSSCVNTTLTSILILRFSFNVNLTISAWNIVGESNRVVHELEPVCNTQKEWEVTTFTFFPDHLRSAGLIFIPHGANEQVYECLQHFLVKIVDLKGNIALEKSLFGYQNSNLTVQFELARNTEYFAIVRVFLSSEYVKLYQTNFTTYDVQRVDIDTIGGGVRITCQFAGGSPARGFMVKILSNKNISRYVELDNECTLNPFSVCTTSTQFSGLELAFENSMNFTIVVYDWENDGSITKVYSEELAMITQSTFTSTTSATIDKMNEWDVIGGITSSTAGLCIIVILLLTVAALLRMKRRNKVLAVMKEQAKLSDKCQPNNAYASMLLKIKGNVAYEQGSHFACLNIPSAEPHVYEAIHTPRGSPTEPVYTTIV